MFRLFFFYSVENFFGDVVEVMVRCHRAVRVHDATVLQKKCELDGAGSTQFLDAKRVCH